MGLFIKCRAETSSGRSSLPHVNEAKFGCPNLYTNLDLSVEANKRTFVILASSEFSAVVVINPLALIMWK